MRPNPATSGGSMLTDRVCTVRERLGGGERGGVGPDGVPVGALRVPQRTASRSRPARGCGWPRRDRRGARYRAATASCVMPGRLRASGTASNPAACQAVDELRRHADARDPGVLQRRARVRAALESTPGRAGARRRGLQPRHGDERPRGASYLQLLQPDAREVVHAEPEPRGVLDVSRLANQDVHVRVEVARAPCRRS